MDNETAAILEIEGKQFNLLPGRNYLIGRLAQTGQKLDIGLRSENVDAKHAVVRVHHDQIKLLDLYSNSGTFWNGQRLEGLKEVTLERYGTLQFGTVVASLTEIPDNSDFNKSPKDASNIICSSPKLASQTVGNFKKSQNDLTSGHEMYKESGFQEPSVPVRTSNVSNTSRHSLNIPCTQEMSLNGSLGNKTADSFCIPETQCPARVQLSVNSIAGNKSSDKGVDSMVKSNDDEDYDFSIPETQEVPAYSKNQIDKQLDYEKAVLDANLPQNILAEDDGNMIAGSQFRICTQDFNEASYSDADDSDDLLLRVPDFAMIPTIQQKPVMLGDTACPIATATEVKESQPRVTDSAEDGAVADKELLAIQCSDQVDKSNEVIDERDEMCTPDLFDLPELAQLNAKEAFHDCSFTKSSENTDSSGHTTEVKEVDTSEKPSTSFKLPVQLSSVSLIKVTDPPLFEDHVDLLPTQVFAPKTVGQKKCADGSPEYLTLSDKENVKPTAAVMLAPFGDMEPTQTFSTSESNNSLRGTEAELLIPAEVSTKTVAKTSSNGENMLPPVSIAEEDDFLPTQVFTARRVKTTEDNDGQPSVSKYHGSASVPSNVERINEGETILERPVEHTPQKTTNVNLCKPTVSISKVISNATTVQSPDIDMLLCTPQIIVENFKQPVSTTKSSIIGKQKVLFGDDSDEDSDALELIAAPKVCHDFDKLLPHLSIYRTKKQMSPKRDEVYAKMHLYNQSFTKLDKTQKNKRGDGNQMVVSSNRGQRHEARDWKRDKIAEASIETEKRVRDKIAAKVPKTAKGNDVNVIQTVSTNEKMENDEAAEMMSKNAKTKHDKVDETGSKIENGEGDNGETVSRNNKKENDKVDKSVSKNEQRKHDKEYEAVSKHNKVNETESKNDKGETVSRNNKREDDKVDKSVSKNEQRKHDKEHEAVSKHDKVNETESKNDKGETVSRNNKSEDDKVDKSVSKNEQRKHDKEYEAVSKHDKVNETESKNDKGETVSRNNKREDDKVDKSVSKNEQRKHDKEHEAVSKHDKVNETESKNDKGETVSRNNKSEDDKVDKSVSKNEQRKHDKEHEAVSKHDKVNETESKNDKGETVSRNNKSEDDKVDKSVSKNEQRKHDKEYEAVSKHDKVNETESKNDQRKRNKVAETVSKHDKVTETVAKGDKREDDKVETVSKTDKGGDDKVETVSKNNKREDDIVDKSVSKSEQRKHDKEEETASKNDRRKHGKVSEKLSKHDKVDETKPKNNDKRKRDKVAETVSKHDKVNETESKNDKRKRDKVAETVSKHDKVDEIESKNYKRKRDKVSDSVSNNDKRKRDKVAETLSKNDNIEQNTNRTRSNTKESIKIVEHTKRGRKRNNRESTSETNAKSRNLENSKKSKEHEVDKRKNERIINKAEDEELGACDKTTEDESTSRSTRSQSRLHSHSSTTDAFAKVTTRRMTRLQSHRIELETQAIETTTKATSNDAVERGQGRPRRCTTKNEKEHHNKQHYLRQPKITYITLDSSDSNDDSSVNANNSIETTKGKNLCSLNSFNDSTSTKTVSSPKSTSNSSTHQSRHLKKLKVSMTMVDSEYFESLSKNSTGIWTIASDPTESDILIMDKSNRTYKFLVAMARGIPIVTSRWLECVNKKGTIVNMSEHFYTDEAFEKRHRFSLIKSIEMARKQKIFADYDFLMTPDVRPIPHELKTIILCAGGSVHVDVPPIRCNQKLYLVSTKSDQKLWHRYRRLNSNIRIIRSEGVMMSVMRQSIKPLDSNLLA